MQNKWTDPKCQYCVDQTQSGLTYIHGSYYVGGVEARFSLAEQTAGEYKLRGHISLISPVDGHILQVSNKVKRAINERRKAKSSDPHPIAADTHVEAFNASSAIYSKVMDEATIKNKISTKAESLYAENIQTIYAALNQPIVMQDLTPSLAVALHAEQFINGTQAKAEKTRAQNINTLKRVANMVNDYAMDSIPATALKTVYKSLGNSAQKSFKLASRFWDYCRTLNHLLHANPFADYLCKNPVSKSRNASRLQQQAVTPQILDPSQELALNQLIMRKCEADARYLGLSLIKDAGLCSADACGLKWSDILFDDDDINLVRIIIRKPDLRGATHDFTRPCFVFAATLLHAQYEKLLRSGISPSKISAQFVVAKASPKKRTETKELTALCRTTLLHINIGYASLQKDAETASRVGAGVRFLLNTYRYKIGTECGLETLDPAAMKYLLGNSLQYDVTADSYRSFSGPDGQRYLYHALQRDCRFTEFNDSASASPALNQQTGCYEAAVSQSDIMRPAECEIVVTLRRGEMIQLSSQKGIKATVSARVMTADGKVKRKKGSR